MQDEQSDIAEPTNELEHAALTEQIIGAAIEVQRALGPGFLESVYENALVLALGRRGLRVERQKTIRVFFEGQEVGHHRLDLLVEDVIVVELKCVRALEDAHFAVVRSYLRAAGREHGLLLNFSKPRVEVRRVISPPVR